MVSDSEGTPLLADLVRTQFTNLAEMNRQRFQPVASPHDTNESSEHSHSASTPNQDGAQSESMDSALELSKSMSTSAKRLSSLSSLLQRSIHIGREEEGHGGEPLGVVSPESLASTHDLEEILRLGDAGVYVEKILCCTSH